MTEARQSNRTPLAVVLGSALAADPQVLQAIAPQTGLEYVDLSEHRPDPAVIGLLPDHIARRYRAVPLRRDGTRLVVGMANPSDLPAVDDLRAVLGEPFTRVLVAAGQLDDVLDAGLQARRGGPVGRPDRGRGHDRRPARPGRPASGHRGRAHRQVRQPRDPAGRAGAGVGHPRRADRARPAHPLPHRRRAARADAPAPLDHRRRGVPPQGHGRDRHRRAPASPGRPHRAQRGGQGRRPAGVDPAHRARREGRDADPRPGQRGAAPRRPRLPAPAARPLPDRLREALRRHPRHRADRVGQVDDALRHPQPAQRPDPRTS